MAACYLDDAATREQNVCALEVAVHDIFGVDEVAARGVRRCKQQLGLTLDAGRGRRRQRRSWARMGSQAAD